MFCRSFVSWFLDRRSLAPRSLETKSPGGTVAVTVVGQEKSARKVEDLEGRGALENAGWRRASGLRALGSAQGFEVCKAATSVEKLFVRSTSLSRPFRNHAIFRPQPGFVTWLKINSFLAVGFVICPNSLLLCCFILGPWVLYLLSKPCNMAGTSCQVLGLTLRSRYAALALLSPRLHWHYWRRVV